MSSPLDGTISNGMPRRSATARACGCSTLASPKSRLNARTCTPASVNHRATAGRIDAAREENGRLALTVQPPRRRPLGNWSE